MKIKNLYIENEKRLKNLNINFENNGKILDVVVLAGINGMGKTTVLEVISDYFENIERNLKNKNKIDIKFESGEKNLDNLVANRETKVIYVPATVEFSNNLWNDDSFLELSKEKLSYTIGTYKFRSIPDYIRSKIMNKVTEGIDKSSQQIMEEVFSEINEIFQVLDENIDIKLVGMSKASSLEEILPIFKNSSGDTFDINSLSSGEKQLFLRTLAIKTMEPQNSIILIDEPELSLHPRWQQRIVDVYRKIGKNNQIIIATHSPHILGSVRKENIMLLDKDDEGQIVVRTGDELYDSYGQPTDRVLKDIMGLETTRNPKVFKLLEEAGELVDKNEYESEEFKTKYTKLREILGNKDEDLLLMDMDIQIRKKRGLKNVESR
ncbi:AAA family ATPase [Leptotrichia hofstadii]|uniref:AAA+ ATPase domain-containing protein n=1 Tax=Leptotrichia hofstadii F0254 TaxID=634994 RepID=C9N1A6_9FUSO|nr:ATP-binding protein [Leptotrichia hofstadii]EEX73299.1 hypothetical protein GCWU000323_02627 [Leptotrichia hofstadii F0254]